MKKILLTTLLLLATACARDYGDLTETTHKNIDKIVGWGAICENGTVRDVACGFNNRGARPQKCESGAWVDNGDCVDPDDCLDDDTRVVERVTCLDTIGDQMQKCIEGHWTDDGLCRSLVPTIAPHEGRFYLETTPIQISAETTGTTIRYTLDGTEPTATVGTLYTDPFVIADGGKKKLKAKVFREGMADSITAVAEYRVIQITCSGQTKCYDNSGEVTCPTEGNDFYGQDAQYAVLGMCIPKSYTVSGATPEEIVTDNNTGLQWQRTLSGNTYTWDNAVAYCEGLAYGGHSDWRLPNYRELESIVEYGRSSPAIDTDAFPGTFSDDFWSSSFCADNTGYAWDINFNYGYFQGYTKISSYHVRCVRVKSQSEELTFTEEAVSGGVVVNETVTGLQWAKEYASSVNWQSALAYCENLNYGGYIDWRLPNIDELKTLINRSRYAPASDFPEMPSAYFWSSSSLAGNALSAWRVNFDDGYVSSNGKYNDYLARCVR